MTQLDAWLTAEGWTPAERIRSEFGQQWDRLSPSGWQTIMKLDGADTFVLHLGTIRGGTNLGTIHGFMTFEAAAKHARWLD